MDDLAEFLHFPAKFINLTGQIVIPAAGTAPGHGLTLLMSLLLLTLLHLGVDFLLRLMGMSAKFIRLFHHTGCVKVLCGSHHVLDAAHHFVQFLIRIRHT